MAYADSEERKLWLKNYVEENRDRINARGRAYRAVYGDRINSRRRNIGMENKRRIVEECGGRCAICNSIFPLVVYNFHHTDPSAKEANLGHLMRLTDFDRIKTEADKCILVCANCHLQIHFPDSQMVNAHEPEYYI